MIHYSCHPYNSTFPVVHKIAAGLQDWVCHVKDDLVRETLVVMACLVIMM